MIFFDLEATGPSPDTDRITQVAVRREGDTSADWHEWEALVNPGQPIPPAVAELTGITDERVATCQPFAAVAQELADLLAGQTLVGFNCLRFDVPLLAAEFDRAGVAFDWGAVTVLDLFVLDGVANPRTLSAVYARLFRKPLDGAHGAMADAVATRDVFREIVHRYPALRGKTAEELALLSNHGRRRADPAGKLGYDDAGRLVYAFGAHRGKPVAEEPGYARWMLSKDFPPATCHLLAKELARLEDEWEKQQDDIEAGSPDIDPNPF